MHLKVHLLNIDLGSDLAKGAARVQLHFAGIIPGGGQKNLGNHVYDSVLNILISSLQCQSIRNYKDNVFH